MVYNIAFFESVAAVIIGAARGGVRPKADKADTKNGVVMVRYHTNTVDTKQGVNHRCHPAFLRVCAMRPMCGVNLIH